MTANIESLLARVRTLGWAVSLVHGTPTLTKAESEAAPIPPSLLKELKVSRDPIIRHLVIVSLFARADGKRIWGYDSDDGRAQVPFARKGILGNWDRLCVEGDKEWTFIPKLIISK